MWSQSFVTRDENVCLSLLNKNFNCSLLVYTLLVTNKLIYIFLISGDVCTATQHLCVNQQDAWEFNLISSSLLLLQPPQSDNYIILTSDITTELHTYMNYVPIPLLHRIIEKELRLCLT